MVDECNATVVFGGQAMPCCEAAGHEGPHRGRVAENMTFSPGKTIAPEKDAVNHPQHYTFGGIEVIDALEAWQLGYHLGNVVKYVVRADHKGKALEDLKKARWYLDREIARREKEARK